MGTALSWWERFKIDARERFMNWETVQGVYKVPAGIIGIWVTYHIIEQAIPVICYAILGFCILDGLYNIWVNRVKQDRVFTALTQLRDRIWGLLGFSMEKKVKPPAPPSSFPPTSSPGA